jgi:uncharacterized protein (DUF1778 family)
MAIAKTEDRICERVPETVYELLSEAASMMGATINQFLVQSAVEKAHEVIQRENTIRLSAQAAKMVFDAIENPQQPSERLVVAIRKKRDLAGC